MAIEVKEVCSPILIKMPNETIKHLLENQEESEEDQDKDKEEKDKD